MWSVTNILFVITLVSLAYGATDDRCEVIAEPLCRDVGYNLTTFPNPLGHGSQEEASAALAVFSSLVQDHCTERMLLVICSMYTPICVTNYRRYLPICRHVCHQAFAECRLPEGQVRQALKDAIMGPSSCDDFPEYGAPSTPCMAFSILPQDLSPKSTTPVPAITLSPEIATSVHKPIEDVGPHNVNLDECSCKIHCDCPATP